MGITVKHQPSPEVIGDAAFEVGRGEAYQRYETRRHDREVNAERARQQKKAMVLQSNLQEKLMRVQAELGGRGRGHSPQSAQPMRQMPQPTRADFENMPAMDRKALHELKAQEQLEAQKADRFKREQNARIHEMIKSNPSYMDNIAIRSLLAAQEPAQLTPVQQKRVGQLQGVIEWTNQQQQTGAWSPEEAAQVIQNAQKEMDSIVPPRQPEQPSPEKWFADNSFVDQETGQKYFRYPDGKLEPLGKPRREAVPVQNVIDENTQTLPDGRMIVRDPETNKLTVVNPPPKEDMTYLQKTMIDSVAKYRLTQIEEPIYDKEGYEIGTKKRFPTSAEVANFEREMAKAYGVDKPPAQSVGETQQLAGMPQPQDGEQPQQPGTPQPMGGPKQISGLDPSAPPEVQAQTKEIIFGKNSKVPVIERLEIFKANPSVQVPEVAAQIAYDLVEEGGGVPTVGAVKLLLKENMPEMYAQMYPDEKENK